MKVFFLAVAVLAASVAVADTNVYARRVTINSPAQVDAEEMARTGVLRHCGRTGRREGIAFSTAGPDAALRSCCYYGRYRIAEKAVAWSPVRRGWFAVIRYE